MRLIAFMALTLLNARQALAGLETVSRTSAGWGIHGKAKKS
jgi:hypothetical protein